MGEQMSKKKKAVKVKGAELEQAMPKPADDDWQSEDHLRTLMSAHEIMNNPEKLKKVHKLAGRKAQAIRGIQDIKNHYNEKYGGKSALKGLGPQEGAEGEESGE